jgi:alpha-L-fucosidase
MLNRRTALVTALTCWPMAAMAQTQPTSYSASWASVDQHPPAPEWFQDAKFGIYFHWGAFGTAAFGSEWYPRNMFNKAGNSAEYQHQLQVYGDPLGNWGYDKFINGANDKSGHFVQFAPKLVTSGGNWDPDAMAQLIVDSGAWFAGPVAEHHDGFSMWDSKANAWNSASKGPMLNMAAIHAQAFRKKGLKFLMAMHHAYHFTGYYQYVPMQTDPMLQLLYGQQGTTVENQLWLAKLKEIVDEFQPDIIWEDFNLSQVQEPMRLQFLSYYYNAALSWGKEVVATYKDGFDNKGEVYDYERGGAGDITNPYWLTDDAVSPSSWCYTTGMGYYTAQQEVHTFIDHVSKNGSLLLNISPMPDGTIPQQQKDLLSAFGSFLKQFGSAIYNTRAWMVYGEGPTKIGGGSFSGPVAGTPQDVRYTASKDGDAVYAILLGWPGNGKQVTLASVTPARFTVGSGKVYLFGPVGGQAINLTFTQDTSGLHVTLPSTQPYTAVAYAMKISKSGTVPAPTPMINNGSTTPPEVDGGVPDGGGSAGAGGNGGRGGAGGSGMGGRGGGGGGGGTAGATGGAGASGSAGTTGTAGRGGASGSAGAAGTSGSSGTSGTAGAAGVAGSVGTAGTTGGAGTSGSAGTTGAAGSAAPGSAGSGGPGLTDANGGCTCALAERSAGTETWIGALLAPLALVVARRRRRRR